MASVWSDLFVSGFSGHISEVIFVHAMYYGIEMGAWDWEDVRPEPQRETSAPASLVLGTTDLSGSAICLTGGGLGTP